MSTDRYTQLSERAAGLVRWLGMPADTALTWQVFGDRGATDDGKPVVVSDASGKPVAATFAARTDQLAAFAAKHCRHADFPNVYLTFGLHDPPGRRQKESCRRVLALTLDCDACDWLAAGRPADFADRNEAKAHLHQLDDDVLTALLQEHHSAVSAALASAGLPAPSTVWRSGYGHYALYVLAADDDGATDVDLCRQLNSDLVQALNTAVGYQLTDTSVKDAGSRVLRVPGAWNVKRADRPLRCSVLTVDGPKYTAAALREAIPAQVRAIRTHEPQVGTSTTSAPDDDRSTAVEALALLSLARCDNYADWLAVGMALHAVDDSLLDEWDRWSSNSGKYSEGVCADKWRTFHERDGVGMGSLVEWVRADGTPDFLQRGWRSRQHADAAPPARQNGAGGAARLEAVGKSVRFGHCRSGRHKCDDIGNAGRFVELCGDRFKWCSDWQTWLAYDGARWAVDTSDRARQAAHEVARSIYAEAAEIENPDIGKAVARWAGESARRSTIEAMLREARPYLPILSTALDADPYLLNCSNGTVNLRTGKLQPHNPADLVSRVTTSAYIQDAHLDDTPGAKDWRKFLSTVTNGDDELTAYLQRAAGYSVTGDPCEEVLFFAFGPERTGKSTFLTTVEYHLADYAATADFEAFLKKREGGSDARPEIAKLQGRRFVKSTEVARGRSFAEELVKTLTGGETISARALHQNPVEWLPQFTLWLAANDRPDVRHDDGAVWRRLRVVPFVHQMADPDDPNAPAELKADLGLKTRLRETAGEAVISWMVDGCLLWQQEGLGRPAAVAAATSAYRAAMDPIGDWLTECCVTRDDEFTPTEDLLSSYLEWCQANGERAKLSSKDLGAHLSARGFQQARRRFGGRLRHCYNGIVLTDDSEPVPGVPGVPSNPELFSRRNARVGINPNPPGTPGTPGTTPESDPFATEERLPPVPPHRP